MLGGITVALKCKRWKANRRNRNNYSLDKIFRNNGINIREQQHKHNIF
jgi:hypothetical protein